MSEHSVVDARNHLSELIDHALAGEEVVITRHGLPVVTIKAVRSAGRPMTHEILDWIAAGRSGRTDPEWDAGKLVSAMRDEER